MLYFIPSWYRQEDWSENEQSWHVSRKQSEFDDTVKQVQLFHRSGAYPYFILLLSYAPNFRHFLHRQGVFHAPYWSCFDAIQEIRKSKAALFSFRNLNWPKGIEYVYSPFAVVARLQGQKYAQIEFGEDGNMIRIDMYKGGRIRRRNLYDDRGFISSTILYENSKPVYQDYLTEEGVWKMRVFFLDGHVEINPEHSNYLIIYKRIDNHRQFRKLLYLDLEEVICEVFSEYAKLAFSTDLFCVSMHKRHTAMLGKVLKDQKMILSFFEDRYSIDGRPELLQMLRDASYVVTDSKENTAKLLQIYDEGRERITDISPYDSRVDFGISSQLAVQKILVPFDGLEDSRFVDLICVLAAYLKTNGNAQVHLFTRKADYDIADLILEKTREILREAGYDTGWAEQERHFYAAENRLNEQTSTVRFFVEQCVDELAVSRCMREQRLIVDLRDVPKLYLQISAISMGIPQLVSRETQFLVDGKNGRVIQGKDELFRALQFYLDVLSNWNDAMVASYELGKKFSTAELIEKWKEVIKTVG